MHFGRDAALLAQEPEQEVFGAYVIVRQPVGFFGRVLQYALAGSAERDLVGLGDCLAAREAPDNVAARVIEGTSDSREDPAAESLALVQDAEKDMLRLNGDGSGLADF
jgi:hypothetical protein